MTSTNVRLPLNKHFVFILLKFTSLRFSRNDVKKNEKQNGVNSCVQYTQSDYFMIFQSSTNKHFVFILLKFTSLRFSRNDVKKNEKQNGVNSCVQYTQSDYFMIFQSSTTRVFMDSESYKMEE